MSKTDDNTTKPKAPTSYVVLRGNDTGYEVISTVAAVTAAAAKKSVAATLGLQAGDSVTLAAVPAKSWQPQTFTVEVQAPKLVAA